MEAVSGSDSAAGIYLKVAAWIRTGEIGKGRETKRHRKPCNEREDRAGDGDTGSMTEDKPRSWRSTEAEEEEADITSSIQVQLLVPHEFNVFSQFNCYQPIKSTHLEGGVSRRGVKGVMRE